MSDDKDDMFDHNPVDEIKHVNHDDEDDDHHHDHHDHDHHHHDGSVCAHHHLAMTLKIQGAKRHQKKFYILYPESPLKNYWDLVIAFILIVSCAYTPFEISFEGLNQNED